jgi:phosphatidylglycerophosphatase C
MPRDQIVAAFDFDGTSTTSDSLRDFVHYTVGRAQFAVVATRASPWLIGLQAGVRDRGFAKARLVATLPGMTQCELEDAAQQHATRRLPALIRPEMAARIQEHTRRGHRLVLVSTSPALYLRHWVAGAGFDGVLATELEFHGGRFSGSFASPNCLGAGKMRRLQQGLGSESPHVLYAYGDTRDDPEMLALGEHARLRANATDRHMGKQTMTPPAASRA